MKKCQCQKGNKAVNLFLSKGVKDGGKRERIITRVINKRESPSIEREKRRERGNMMFDMSWNNGNMRNLREEEKRSNEGNEHKEMIEGGWKVRGMVMGLKAMVVVVRSSGRSKSGRRRGKKRFLKFE